jgi:chemotaxis protein CheX
MSNDQDSTRMALPEALDTAKAGQLLSDLIAVRGQPLVLDASATRRVGGQCLQVLMAARATWAADKVPMLIADPSPDFLDSLALLGWRDVADLQPVQD